MKSWLSVRNWPPSILFACLVAWILLIIGCATVDVGKIVTPARVESVTRLSAYVSARALLLESPELRPQLEAASRGFHELRQAERWDLPAMGAIAAASGLDQVASAEGVLILTGTTLFIDTVLGVELDLAEVDYARAVVIGADDGLALALKPATRGDPETLHRLHLEAEATRVRARPL